MSDLLLWFVAGEESGDTRAAEVMRAMKSLNPAVRFGGCGGSRMAALCEGEFDEWSGRAAVTGLWDVLKNYGYFRKKFRVALKSIRREQPAAVVLIDYPGFNLRLAAALRRANFPGKILYYISPQVWAWNRSRIPRMAEWLDLMVCVFPFEPPMYEASGLPAVFSGHPLLESLPDLKNAPAREPALLGLFPGSREREVKRNFPAMVEAARLVKKEMPEVRFAAAASSEQLARKMLQIAGFFTIDIRAGTAHELMQRATAGIVCSGTATLEAAYFGLPHCIIYKTAWLTFQVGRRLVDVNALGIANILNNYRLNPPTDPMQPAAPTPHIVREFIQNDATPAALAAESLRLLREESARTSLRTQLSEILTTLRPEGATTRAAKALLATASRPPAP
jgi:lipid-A-disaccharide synthase